TPLHPYTPTPFSIKVRFAGGNLQLIQDWLGTNLVYQLQGEGDLGERMMRSLVDAFQSGAEKVVIIGIDCPDINAQILAQAFEQLRQYDLVLGPAVDGGYYLIGLQRPIPELFTNISWGTSEVLQKTINIAQKLNLSVFSLPLLADIDRPEDLPLWEKIFKEQRS
ncbi:MAG: TIGR04282 family arsenosugar biosynthesis glycosyltransferase, partial [Scytonema sp. PMC 1070.18]|nr:TIGR04282 family arsenosugar biosynthesis glycosyltransferase [Scytonema sp. PMC 1070.18]